jgi:hypothetical protein
VIAGILLLLEVACVARLSQSGVELRRQQQASTAATDSHDSYDMSHETIQRVMN